MSFFNHKIGERVGAIFGANDEKKEVSFLGFGVYDGDFIPDQAVGFAAEWLKKHELTNPRITLDTKKVVYGCECWWGSEEKIKDVLEHYRNKGYTIIDTDIDTIRKEYTTKNTP